MYYALGNAYTTFTETTALKITERMRCLMAPSYTVCLHRSENSVLTFTKPLAVFLNRCQEFVPYYVIHTEFNFCILHI